MKKQNGKKIEVGLLSQILCGSLNLILASLKLYIGTFTNCISILSDGVNNIVDFGANVCGGIGMHFEQQPPTKKHPHGFGRLEDIISFCMLFAAGIVGFYFIYSSIERFFFHPPIFFIWWGFGIVCGTVVVKIIMYFIYARAYKVNPSPILRINKIDCILDASITFITLVSYIVSALKAAPVDSVMGIVIGLVLFVSVIRLFIQNIDVLIGNDDSANKVAQEIIKRGLTPTNVKAHAYGRRIEGVVIIEENIDATEIVKDLKNNKIFVTIIQQNKVEG